MKNGALKEWKKTNNHPRALSAKVTLRDFVLSEIGASEAKVFDAFAGDGELYRHVWSRASDYVGCDLKWYRDGRLTFVADNRRVLRSIQLGAFNVFDFDAYGSPWEQVLILCARRHVAVGERIGLALTEGSSMKVRLSGMPQALGQLAGMRGMPGMGKNVDLLIDRAIVRAANLLGCDIVKRWQARGKTGSAMRYIGLVLEGTKKAASVGRVAA